MKKLTLVLVTTVLLAAAGTASAKMNPLPIMQTSGMHGGGGGGGSCQSSGWGNSSSGGTNAACSYGDGSSWWFMSEWGAGWYSSVTGSCTAGGACSETSSDSWGT